MSLIPTWQSPCGRVQLYHGDNLVILPQLAPLSIDAVVTDPPYGISDGERLVMSGAEIATMDHEWDREIPLTWIPLAARLMVPGAAAIVWTDRAKCYSVLAPALEAAGIASLNSLVWNRTQASMNPRKNFGNCFEMAIFARKAGKVHCWTGGDHRANLIRAARIVGVGSHINARIHPTQKPVRVMEWCIEPITLPGMVVLDPFMGSGATGVAALRMGRLFIGIEIDGDYFEGARARLAAEASQGRLFESMEKEKDRAS